MTATYHDIGGPDGLLARLQEFQGNSMSARWHTLPSGTSAYTVYSYRTPIARYCPPEPTERETNDMFAEFSLNDTYYSVTTANAQSLVRAWLGHSTDLRDFDPS